MPCFYKNWKNKNYMPVSSRRFLILLSLFILLNWKYFSSKANHLLPIKNLEMEKENWRLWDWCKKYNKFLCCVWSQFCNFVRLLVLCKNGVSPSWNVVSSRPLSLLWYVADKFAYLCTSLLWGYIVVGDGRGVGGSRKTSHLYNFLSHINRKFNNCPIYDGIDRYHL